MCAAFDEVLHIVTHGGTARLNCTPCEGDVVAPLEPFGPPPLGRSAPLTCAPTRPRYPKCAPALRLRCGAGTAANATVAACEACVATNARNLTARFGCRVQQLVAFCPPSRCCAAALHPACGAARAWNASAATCAACVASANATLGGACTQRDAVTFCAAAPPPPQCAATLARLCGATATASNTACVKCAEANAEVVRIACGRNGVALSALYCKYARAPVPQQPPSACEWDLGRRASGNSGKL